MAPKRSLLDEPPAGSSSEDEETTSGEDEEEEEEDEEEEEEEKVDSTQKISAPLPSSASATDKNVTPKKQDPPIVLQAQGSSSESESVSESESDAEAEENVKPIASKPMEENTKRQKIREKEDMTAISSLKKEDFSVSSSVKRPSQSARATKRAKKGSEAVMDDGAVEEDNLKKTGDDSKKLFQRIWSEEDEIVILKGISDYTEKKGFEPPADMNDFLHFIKKYLHIDVSRSQLRDKVQRLKKKYKNNLRRGDKGEDPTFTKPHEQKTFELAKKIWGEKVETPFPQQPLSNETTRKSRIANSNKSLRKELFGMPENVEENDKMHGNGNLAQSSCLNELLDFNENLGRVGLSESVVKWGLEMIDGSKKAELNQQQKKLHVAELELFVKRTELVRDQARLILEAYKKSNK